MRLFHLIFLIPSLVLLSGSTDTPKDLLLTQENRTGKDFALFFPVANYTSEGLENLPQTITEANEIAKELRLSFGFETEIVPNATMEQIAEKLKEYANRFQLGSLPEDGQLLIFFSGHGETDRVGYFLPADADPKRLYNTGMEYNYWRHFISEINCRHILVAIDACHSVKFDPNNDDKAAGGARRKGELTDTQRVLKNHQEYQARIFFTSDSKNDTTPGESNFARKFLEGLRNLRSPNGFVSSSQLFSNHIDKAFPPAKSSYFEGDNPSSAFLFFHDKVDIGVVVEKETELEAWTAALKQDNCTAYRNFLRKFPAGSFASDAVVKIEPCDALDKMNAAWERAEVANSCEGYQDFMDTYPNTLYAKKAKDNWKEIGCTPLAVPGKMTYFPGGSYKMGDEVDKPEYGALFAHSVTIGPFYISATELTNKEYAEFLTVKGNQTQGGTPWYNLTGRDSGIERSGNAYRAKEGMGDHPVVNVSWYGAIAYCNWLSTSRNLDPVYKMSGTSVTADWTANGYRLPTEAEWEYAARSGGTMEKWAGTSNEEEIVDFLNFMGSKDGHRYLAPISTFQANKKGLADMSGNVTEWCWDWHDQEYYKSSPAKNPRGPGSGTRKVLRGGSWNHALLFCTTTQRYSERPSIGNNKIGFRLARNWSRNTYGRSDMKVGDKAKAGG